MSALRSLGLGLGASLFALLPACSDDSGSKPGGGAGSGGTTQGGASGSGGSGGDATAGRGGNAGSAGAGASGAGSGGAQASGGSAGTPATGGSGGASTGGSAGSTAGTSAGGTGGAACPTGLDDEFDDPCTLSQWTAENFPASAASFDIGTTQSGFLTYTFSANTPAQTGWYATSVGPILHKRVSGDFWVMASLSGQSVSDPNAAPTRSYNSAAILVRDVATPGHWLMHSLGFQGGNSNGPGAGLPAGCPNQGDFVGLGSEAKTTVNQASTLCLNPVTSFRGRLAICRVGSQFRMLRKLDNESTWVETNRFTHDQIGSAMDVGPVANGWGVPPDVSPRFDWIHFGVPASDDDCSAAAFDAAHP